MKYVYSFKEGNKDMRNILGGKGANLAQMVKIGLSVPNGFTVSTDACLSFYENKNSLNDSIKKEIENHIKELEEDTSKTFGSKSSPLLVSVRSGARVSMPGMMDTVLNLGMNDTVCETLANKTNNPRFAYDSYRRFIQMFSDVVKNLPKSSFEGYFDNYKKEKNILNDTELTTEDLKDIVTNYKRIYKELLNEEFPSDPYIQLYDSINAVFNSWNNDRAVTYRRLNNIPSEWGTAVNVQMMVYGNMGDTSGTGVAFTRNPSTGENKLYGEYLINAQGEDVVAGIRTPEVISSLEKSMPEVYIEFKKNAETLEKYYKDMQDMEFTIENKKLYMLQTRNGKRTAFAAIKIAVDMVSSGLITKEEALLSVDAKSLDNLLHNTFDEEELKTSKEIAIGLAASPGSSYGKIYFTAEDVKKAQANNIKDIILVREETSPEDIEGMHIASGILTSRGGMTSHAAVVARGMGTCCICGCSDIKIDETTKTLKTNTGIILHEGDIISLDGSTGKVYNSLIKTKECVISNEFKTFMSWADEIRTMKVRANADTKEDALYALSLGAEGIGLCRTEHMFFEQNRIFNFRKMILSSSKEEREEALESILKIQQKDFEDIFESLKEKPATIRYLDPPLHEFLPKTEEEIKSLAASLKIKEEELISRIEEVKEVNPMMGHRGVRLSITYPDICVMQTTAIIKAAIKVQRENNIKIIPELMVPLVCDVNEIKYIKEIITTTINKILKEENMELNYSIGTMIEIPRAALTADKIVEYADFFSFGTNDLTQMTYGFSRDDSSKFLNDYYKKQIFSSDPFSSIDDLGVGELISYALQKAKAIKPNLKTGICGEHGGDPKSIELCYNLGLDYVSCSPFRVPIARLAAAQAVLKKEK
ncbi:MAG: pyruvate, phosphate dikinase [Bacilli bacterium]